MISEYNRRIQEAKCSGMSMANIQEMERRVKLISKEFKQLTGTPCEYFLCISNHVVVVISQIVSPVPSVEQPCLEENSSCRRTSADSDITLLSRTSSSPSVRRREYCFGCLEQDDEPEHAIPRREFEFSMPIKRLIISGFHWQLRILRKQRSTGLPF